MTEPTEKAGGLNLTDIEKAVLNERQDILYSLITLAPCFGMTESGDKLYSVESIAAAINGERRARAVGCYAMPQLLGLVEAKIAEIYRNFVPVPRELLEKAWVELDTLPATRNEQWVREIEALLKRGGK